MTSHETYLKTQELVNGGMTIAAATDKMKIHASNFYGWRAKHRDLAPVIRPELAKTGKITIKRGPYKKSSQPTTFIVPESSNKVVFLMCAPEQLSTLLGVVNGK